MSTPEIRPGPHARPSTWSWFDEDLLRAMADAGGGAAYYIEDPDQAPGIFEEEIEGLLSLAAQNVTLTLSPEAGTTLARIRHSYPATETEQGLRLDIGDLYAREPRLVLMEFDLEGAEPGARLDVATIAVRGYVLNDDGVEEREIALPIRLEVGDGPRVDPEVRRISLLLDAADARERALEARDRGDWDGAGQVLGETALRLEEAAPGDPDAVREVKSLRDLAARMDRDVFEVRDAKYMKQQAYDERRSRGAARGRYERG